MYIPSVNIEYQNSDDLHYLITPNARAVLGTMIERFQAGVHSFQIIGNYGTGKSSFLLALQCELQKDSSDLIQDKRVFNSFEKFEFCNIVGDYNSMANVLSKKLSLATHGSDNVLTALDDYYKKTQKEGKFLFVFVDEFGKILEYAASNPEEELYFIQRLTEYVNVPQRNMMLITVLHQSFSAYAQKLSELQRNEWNKVKGRFHDIVFYEPVEQLLYLASVQLDSKKKKISKSLTEICYLAAETKFVSAALSPEVMASLNPLDAFSATVLTLAFQRYGQNERSLFSFLSAKGKGSIEELKNKGEGCYSLTEAYDYISYTFYSTLTGVNADSAGWRMLKVALERVESGTNGITDIESSEKVVKTIGLFNIFANGDANLRKESLERYCELALGIECPGDVIKKLERAKIIRFAGYKQRYILFEGTDVDIEYELNKAASVVPEAFVSADSLRPYFKERVVLANSTYHKTGCPRYFEFILSNGGVPAEQKPEGDIDGFVALTFPQNKEEKEAIVKSSEVDKRAIVYAMFNDSETLRKRLTEISKLIYLKQVIGVEDHVALCEIEHQIHYEVYSLDIELNQSLYDASDKVTWIYRGAIQPVSSMRQFYALLGEVCDDVYGETPIVRCEMLNKEKVGATISKARLTLLKAMLSSADKEDLELGDKFPPEKTIYNIVLKQNGIHRQKEGDAAYGLYAPTNNQVLPLWHACESFLEGTREKKRKLTDLVMILQERPFKLKQGLMDLWIPMFLIVEQSKYALFNNRKYIPYLTGELLELLPKNLKDYSIKAFSQDNISKEIFNKYREFLRKPESEFIDKNTFNNTYNQFFIFYRNLNNYSKQTRKFDSPYTAKFRDILAMATDPEKAIFEDLPESLGLNGTLKDNPNACDNFLEQLRTSVHELVVCYDVFIDRIEASVVDALGLTGDYPHYKTDLENRYLYVRRSLLPQKTLSFLQRVLSPAETKKEFYEKIGSLIFDKSLVNITDGEEDYLIDNILYLFRELDSYVEMSHYDETKNEVFHFEMVSSGGNNVKRQTVVLSKRQATQTASLEDKIAEILTGNNEVDTAALLHLLSKKMKEDGYES